LELLIFQAPSALTGQVVNCLGSGMFSQRYGHQLKTCFVLVALEEKFSLAEILANREPISVCSPLIAQCAQVLMLCSLYFALLIRSASQPRLQLVDGPLDLYSAFLDLQIKIPALGLLKGFSFPEAFG